MTLDQKPVRVIRSLKGKPEQVFDAWLNPKTIAKWITASPGDKSVNILTDAIPGTQFSFVIQRNGKEVNHIGEYIEIRRPHRLVFTWGVEGMPMGESRVAIDFEPNARDTFLTLTHTGVLAEYKDRTHSGWERVITAIDSTLT